MIHSWHHGELASRSSRSSAPWGGCRRQPLGREAGRRAPTGRVRSRTVFVDPSHENIQALLDRAIDGPVMMLNLLRFRDVADYSEHPHLAPAEPITGRDAYDRYVRHTQPFLEATGGSVVMIGEGGNFFVGPIEERWDLAMLVRQNSVADFFSFASNPDYLTGTGHRTAAVEDTRLLPLVDLPVPPRD